MPRTVQPSVTARIPRRPAPVIHTRPLDPDPQLHDDLKRRLSELALRLDEGVPMVFELGAPVAPGRVHRAHAVYLPAALGTILNAVEQARRERLGKEGALPTSMLRLLLETQVPDVLRTEVKLYKLTRATPPHPMVITMAAPDEAQRETRKALASWMLNHLILTTRYVPLSPTNCGPLPWKCARCSSIRQSGAVVSGPTGIWPTWPRGP